MICVEGGSQRSGTSSRKSVGDPTAISSRRSSAFGRYERRLCSKIVEEMIPADDAAPFILPVDTRAVSNGFAIEIEAVNFVNLNRRYLVWLWFEEQDTRDTQLSSVYTAQTNPGRTLVAFAQQNN